MGFPQFLKHATYIPKRQAPTLLGGFSRRFFCEILEVSMKGTPELWDPRGVSSSLLTFKCPAQASSTDPPPLSLSCVLSVLSTATPP